VALARAFARSPRLALLDEPFSALDAPLRQALTADLRRVIDSLGIPVVHVTHDRVEARALGDRVLMLEGGRLARSGATADLLGDA
jgi:ABC-type sulfate/molybdate transport systems ATPase subunit